MPVNIEVATCSTPCGCSVHAFEYGFIVRNWRQVACLLLQLLQFVSARSFQTEETRLPAPPSPKPLSILHSHKEAYGVATHQQSEIKPESPAFKAGIASTAGACCLVRQVDFKENDHADVAHKSCKEF